MAELTEDILEKFLKETKEAEEKKKKQKKIELPENFVVFDPKEATKRRRDAALAALKNLTERPDLKKTSVGSVLSQRKRNPAPSTSFGVKKKEVPFLRV